MDNAFNLNPQHATPIDGVEVSDRLRRLLKSAGVRMFITDARVSAVFPDGSVARYQPVHVDTER